MILIGAAAFGAIGHVAVNRIDDAAHTANWRLALARTNDAAAIEPWSAEPWQHLGDEAAAGRRNGLARDAYLQAVRRSPHDWELWFDVARTSTGRLHVSALARARALDPLEPELAAVRK